MKHSSKLQVIAIQERESALITRTQIYLAVAFIYIYFLTTIFL